LVTTSRFGGNSASASVLREFIEQLLHTRDTNSARQLCRQPKYDKDPLPSMN
jgi:hypothetical protein